MGSWRRTPTALGAPPSRQGAEAGGRSRGLVRHRSAGRCRNRTDAGAERSRTSSVPFRSGERPSFAIATTCLNRMQRNDTEPNGNACTKLQSGVPQWKHSGALVAGAPQFSVPCQALWRSFPVGSLLLLRRLPSWLRWAYGLHASVPRRAALNWRGAAHHRRLRSWSRGRGTSQGLLESVLNNISERAWRPSGSRSGWSSRSSSQKMSRIAWDYSTPEENCRLSRTFKSGSRWRWRPRYDVPRSVRVAMVEKSAMGEGGSRVMVLKICSLTPPVRK